MSFPGLRAYFSKSTLQRVEYTAHSFLFFGADAASAGLHPKLYLSKNSRYVVSHITGGDDALAVGHNGNAMSPDFQYATKMKPRQGNMSRLRTVVPVELIADAKDLEIISRHASGVLFSESFCKTRVPGCDEIGF